MTDAILTHLAAIGGLRLISRTSVMRFKGTNRSIPDIARELSVGCVVEGAVLRSGERVRISIQLIDTVSDTTMWARNYERALGDVIALQTDVARAIAEEIRVRLTPGEVERLGAIADVDPSAYEAYLRGRFLWNRRTRPDVQRALEFFRRAVEMSPRYAQAHAGIADCYNVLGDMDLLSNAEALAAVRAAAGRALELDPRLAEAHTSLGFALTFYAWDWAGAQSAFERAALEGPGYATGHQWYAEFLVSQGRFEEAERESRLALTLDPLSLVIRTSLADVLYFSRRFDEAIAILKATLEVDPAFPAALSDLGRSYAQAGRYDEAIVAFEEARRLGFIGKYSAGLAHSYALAGRTDEARAILAELKRERQERYVSPHAIAVVHIGLGEFEDALQWLERAHEAHDRALIWIKVHPRLDPLRSEPRLTRIIEAMKL
jgi:tetratricopeptide (TPR) repeat protein